MGNWSSYKLIVSALASSVNWLVGWGALFAIIGY